MELLLLSLLTTLQVLYWVASSRVLQHLDVADIAWEVKKIPNQRFSVNLDYCNVHVLHVHVFILTCIFPL